MDPCCSRNVPFDTNVEVKEEPVGSQDGFKPHMEDTFTINSTYPHRPEQLMGETASHFATVTNSDMSNYTIAENSCIGLQDFSLPLKSVTMRNDVSPCMDDIEAYNAETDENEDYVEKIPPIKINLKKLSVLNVTKGKSKRKSSFPKKLKTKSENGYLFENEVESAENGGAQSNNSNGIVDMVIKTEIEDSSPSLTSENVSRIQKYLSEVEKAGDKLNKSSLVCNLCKKKMRSKAGYEKHVLECTEIVTQTVDGRYECMYCGKSYGLMTSLQRHLRFHRGDDKYKCKVCDRQFSDLKSLRGHTRIHTGEKPFTCDICSRAFRDKSTWQKHVRRHGDESEKTLKCEHCDKKFFMQVDLKKHMHIHSSNEERKYGCDECGKKFYLAAALARHIRVHTGEKPFKCSYCPLGFTDQTGLTCHERTHTGYRPFQCDFCGRTFTWKCHLDRHLRIHSEIKPYRCTECDRQYTASAQLKIHMRTHSGERPFQCQFCYKGFKDSSGYWEHIRTHTGIKKYKCEICEKSFSRNYILNRHMNAKHSGKPASGKYVKELTVKLKNNLKGNKNDISVPEGLQPDLNAAAKVLSRSWQSGSGEEISEEIKNETNQILSSLYPHLSERFSVGPSEKGDEGQSVGLKYKGDEFGQSVGVTDKGDRVGLSVGEEVGTVKGEDKGC